MLYDTTPRFFLEFGKRKLVIATRQAHSTMDPASCLFYAFLFSFSIICSFLPVCFHGLSFFFLLIPSSFLNHEQDGSRGLDENSNLEGFFFSLSYGARTAASINDGLINPRANETEIWIRRHCLSTFWICRDINGRPSQRDRHLSPKVQGGGERKGPCLGNLAKAGRKRRDKPKRMGGVVAGSTCSFARNRPGLAMTTGYDQRLPSQGSISV